MYERSCAPCVAACDGAYTIANPCSGLGAGSQGVGDGADGGMGGMGAVGMGIGMGGAIGQGAVHGAFATNAPCVPMPPVAGHSATTSLVAPTNSRTERRVQQQRAEAMWMQQQAARMQQVQTVQAVHAVQQVQQAPLAQAAWVPQPVAAGAVGAGILPSAGSPGPAGEPGAIYASGTLPFPPARNR